MRMRGKKKVLNKYKTVACLGLAWGLPGACLGLVYYDRECKSLWERT
jgi:hypothetical protein